MTARQAGTIIMLFGIGLVVAALVVLMMNVFNPAPNQVVPPAKVEHTFQAALGEP